MKSDVAAIIDIGALEVGRRGHSRENLLGHTAGHRRHRRDEPILRKVQRRPPHAPGHRPFGLLAGWLAQKRELAAQLIEDGCEARLGGFIGRANGFAASPVASITRSIGPSCRCSLRPSGRQMRLVAGHGLLTRFLSLGRGDLRQRPDMVHMTAKRA